MIWRYLESFLYRRLVYPKQWWVKLIIALTFGIFVFWFLVFYTPFNLNELGDQKYYPSAVYGLIISAVIFITLMAAPRIAGNRFSEDHFNNLNLFILFGVTLVFISFFNQLYTRYSGYAEILDVQVFNFSVLLSDIFYFPALLIANLVDWHIKKLVVVELPFLENHTSVEEVADKEQRVTVEYPVGKELIEIDAAKFICAFSNQNYSDIFVLNNGEAERILVRIPLSKLMEQFGKMPQVIRCHRTRVVNLAYVTGLIDDEGKTFLKLKYLNEAIPVSRRYPIETHFPDWHKNPQNQA